MIGVVVNGEPAELADGTTVAALVDARVGHTKGVAVAVNQEIVPRSEWPGTELRGDDRIEILTAAQGG